ncbi:MAG: TIGR03663 family protein [Verrucomicrobia bacterium]|nr:TIGR03663 family protein [Verrucomicrobiota bacterium]
MKWMSILFLLALVAGAALRLPKLADRPLHHDEANQAYRFGMLLEEGSYTYDADDHHGPTLYYLTLPIAWLTGAETFAKTSETTYRILPVLFGILLILCTPLLRSGVGCIAVLAAALFTAISPAMAYYSRFYIQEMSLVFFTFLALAAGWHAWHGGSRSWAVVCGLSLGLMFATKETAVIAYASMFGSALLCAIMARKTHLPLKNLMLAAGCAIAIAFVLFSSFFTNLNGPMESILAFKGYLARGSGIDTDHVHPWNFYLRMLTHYRFGGGPVWSEGLILGLGLIGATSIFWKKIPANCNLGLARFLLFYTLLLTLAYSMLSYKTPWCILSFLHGWILLAGIGVATIFGAAQRGRWLRRTEASSRLQSAVVLALLLVPALGTYRLAHRTVFRYAADYRNPYVYAHTAPDFKNLVRRIGELEAVSPKGKELYIQVVADPKETWPLPFYLREFPNTGYWVDASTVPTEPQPDIVISSVDLETDPADYLSEYYGLRADTLLAIHIRRTLWDRFIETRK